MSIRLNLNTNTPHHSAFGKKDIEIKMGDVIQVYESNYESAKGVYYVSYTDAYGNLGLYRKEPLYQKPYSSIYCEVRHVNVDKE